MSIKINLDKAKDIAHHIRREKRTAEFAPLDIKATIPGEAVEAEEKRKEVRAKYSAMQNLIDAAQSADEIKTAIGV